MPRTAINALAIYNIQLGRYISLQLFYCKSYCWVCWFDSSKTKAEMNAFQPRLFTTWASCLNANGILVKQLFSWNIGFTIMATCVLLINRMVPFFLGSKRLANITAIWCRMSWAVSVYGMPPSNGIVPVHVIQPIAAKMKPIPSSSLIFIFWYSLWYFVYEMMAFCTWQTTILLVPITKYIFSYQTFFTVNAT